MIKNEVRLPYLLRLFIVECEKLCTKKIFNAKYNKQK